MTALIANISVPADNDIALRLQVDPALGLTSLDGTVHWNVWEQAFGIPGDEWPPDTSPSPPDWNPIPIISKSSTDGSISIGSPPTSCTVYIDRADTVSLLRNYYHETTLVDVSGNYHTLNCGIMTVTDTRNRP